MHSSEVKNAINGQLEYIWYSVVECICWRHVWFNTSVSKGAFICLILILGTRPRLLQWRKKEKA